MNCQYFGEKDSYEFLLILDYTDNKQEEKFDENIPKRNHKTNTRDAKR